MSALIGLPYFSGPEPAAKVRAAIQARGVSAAVVRSGGLHYLVTGRAIIHHDPLLHIDPQQLGTRIDDKAAGEPGPRSRLPGAVAEGILLQSIEEGADDGTAVIATRQETIAQYLRQPLALVVCGGPRRHLFDASAGYTACPYDAAPLSPVPD